MDVVEELPAMLPSSFGPVGSGCSSRGGTMVARGDRVRPDATSASVELLNVVSLMAVNKITCARLTVD